MYITSPWLAVIALDTKNGNETWKYTPASENTISRVNLGGTLSSNTYVAFALPE